MPKWDASMETPNIDLIGYETTWEEIFMLYHKVYKLKWAPKTVPSWPKGGRKGPPGDPWFIEGPSLVQMGFHPAGETRVRISWHVKARHMVWFPTKNAGDLWPFLEQVAGITWGGPEGSWGSPPSDTGGSHPVAGSHQETEPLCHLRAIWQPWVIRPVITIHTVEVV